MPIPRDQFDKGLDETSNQILKFLTTHPDQAFTVSEVANTIYGPSSPSPDMLTVITRALAEVYGLSPALDDLARQGHVDKKMIKGKPYYTISRR